MVGRERNDRGWDDWMASPIQWTWIWASCRTRWRMGSKRVKTWVSDWTTTRKSLVVLVRTWCFHCRGPKFTKIPQAMVCGQNTKKKKTQTSPTFDDCCIKWDWCIFFKVWILYLDIQIKHYKIKSNIINAYKADWNYIVSAIIHFVASDGLSQKIKIKKERKKKKLLVYMLKREVYQMTWGTAKFRTKSTQQNQQHFFTPTMNYPKRKSRILSHL